MLGYSVVFMFVVTSLLVYLEPYLKRYKLPIYIGIGVILILLASTKEIGIDPDSVNYEETFLSVASSSDTMVEYSFIIISRIVLIFSRNVHFVFFFYALLGVTLKFFAFRQLNEFWFLPVLVYIGYFYEFHELMQIRTGVLSGMFLLAIKPMCEGKRLRAFIYILIGFIFHYSAIILLPLLFLSNKPMSFKRKLAWALLIPIGYVFYFFGFSVLLSVSVNLPYIGEKLAMYQYGTEKGIVTAAVNVFSPLLIFTTFLYFYILYFHNTIIQHNKYFPLMIKILGLGIFSYTALSTFPVLAQRVNLLLRIVSIILYANIYYTLKPKWVGFAIVILVAFVYLNYAMPSISFHIFWNPKNYF